MSGKLLLVKNLHVDSFRILSREQKFLPLNILKGLYIESQQPLTSLNERNENGRGGLVRIQANRAV